MAIPTFSYPTNSPGALTVARRKPQQFGLEYVKLDAHLTSSHTWCQTPTTVVCRLVFCLHGAINWMVIPAQGSKQQKALGAGCFIYDARPGNCRYAVCASKKEAHLMQLRFSREVLVALLGEDPVLPLFPQGNVSGPPRLDVQSITQQMSRTISDIKHTLQHHDDGCLYVMAKGLELLALCCRPDIAEHRTAFVMENRRAIQKAQTILQNNMEDPPSLAQLAAEVGMSVSKLKLLFPKLVGLPPYAYLRQMRMEKAMVLLVERGMNVTEVAMDVGYNSLSYFTKAFYKQFGIYPSQARRQAESHPDPVKAAG